MVGPAHRTIHSNSIMSWNRLPSVEFLSELPDGPQDGSVAYCEETEEDMYFFQGEWLLRVQHLERIHRHCGKAFDAVRSYLDEKGIDYMMAELRLISAGVPEPIEPSLWALPEPAPLMLNCVNKRLFHEVIAPGLRDVCKRWNICLKAKKYVCTGDERDFIAELKVNLIGVIDVQSTPTTKATIRRREQSPRTYI